MMPAHPTAKWRQAFSTGRPIARPPQESEPGPYRAGQQRHQRHPPNDLIPRPVTLAQWREINPVNHRTAPVPRALRKPSTLQNLAGASRDIEIRVRVIVQPYSIKRSKGVES